MAKNMNPFNKTQYGTRPTNLTVSNVKAAMSFYQRALGFAKRGVINAPDGTPIRAELTLRGTMLMLGPENAVIGWRRAKTVAFSPPSLYLYAENVDEVVAKAVDLGATAQGQVMDMFWGDRCGTIVDPNGYTWMLCTDAEPNTYEMKRKIAELAKRRRNRSGAY